jgi:hypothetical protein
VPKELIINPRIIEQLAKSTIKTLLDGIVELVTNCDDSYKRLLEDKGVREKGEIKIHVTRKKGGVCRDLIVEDFAEGMSKEDLEKAIEFAGETSGFVEGRSVRGLFGRGLKETIISLGEGVIETIKDGKVNAIRVWWDRKSKKPFYDFIKSDKKVNRNNGTCISINITEERIKIPEYKNFKEQVSDHYALRDINSSNDRKLQLFFEDIKRNIKHSTEISFKYPEIKKVVAEKEINLMPYEDKVRLIIYESPQPLTSPRNNPCGLAGILIKTNGAILDNQLFKFETEPAALYFFGYAVCDGMEKRLREGEIEIINPNRTGLDWRHEYCQILLMEIERSLEPLILEKRKAIEKKPEKEVKESTKKMLRRLCNLLNELAKKELTEIELPPMPTLGILNLEIKPEFANIQVGKPRLFSIYASDDIIKTEGRKTYITSDNSDIKPLSSEVYLETHSEYPNIWYRYFKVVGEKEDAEGIISATLGDEKAQAKIKVAPAKKREKGKITPRSGGFISDFNFDESLDPPQRVFYKEGVITVFMNSPSVSRYIGSGLEKVETPEGRVLFAELVGEAFCKELARKGIETGKWPMAPTPDGKLEAFNTAINDLQKKYLHKIHEVISEWKFS